MRTKKHIGATKETRRYRTMRRSETALFWAVILGCCSISTCLALELLLSAIHDGTDVLLIAQATWFLLGSWVVAAAGACFLGPPCRCCSSRQTEFPLTTLTLPPNEGQQREAASNVYREWASDAAWNRIVAASNAAVKTYFARLAKQDPLDWQPPRSLYVSELPVHETLVMSAD